MNELQIFNNQEFDKIRTIEIKGDPYFVGVDVARTLGYAKPGKAISDHCKGIRKIEIPSYNQHGAQIIQETNVIPESDVYRLVIKAATQNRNLEIKKKAERFEAFIFDEVLPAIQKHQVYVTSDKLDEILNNPDAAIKALIVLKEERVAKISKNSNLIS